MDLSSRRKWIHKRFDQATLSVLEREMPATELWSLLISVAEQRAAARRCASLLHQYAEDRFVTPALVDQRTQIELDHHLFAVAKSFEAVELAPVAPLGACSVVAPTSQNRVISTMRGTEVVSDPTNVLALECAQRLRRDTSTDVKLATSHRCVRAQPVPKGHGFSAHFRIFSLATAGHETKDQAFTTGALLEHIRVYLAALDRLEQHTYCFPRRIVRLLATQERRPLAQQIVESLGSAAGEISVEPLDKAYYDGLRFMISARAPSGDDIPLIDGGAFVWVAKLADNRKLVFIASALGSQIAAHQFRAHKA